MLRRAAIVLALIGAAALLVVFEVPFCPSATLLGIPCPGCGLTRATLALLSGDLRAAFRFHPLVFVLAPLFVGTLATASLTYVRGASRSERQHLLTSRTMNRLAALLLALVLGVWIARFFGAFGGPVPVRSIAPWTSGAATR